MYSGLDLLRSGMQLDLCAYLHSVPEVGPQLYLRAPDLSSMEPSEAFAVFAQLRDTLEGQHEEVGHFAAGAYEGVSIKTTGVRSKGLHVVGRRDGSLTEQQRDVAARVCRAVASVVHVVEGFGGKAPQASPARVNVEVIEGRARAEVSIAAPQGLRNGSAEGSEPVRAVANAVVAALEVDAKVIDAIEGDVGDERVILVLLTGPFDQRAVGASLSARDLLHATATATLDAVTRLGLLFEQ